VRASKVGLLFLILGFGGTVETAWRVRNEFGVGPWDWRVLTGGKFTGPSYSFEEQETQAVPEGTAVEIDNAFGGVKTLVGAPGEVKCVLRKVVYRNSEADAEAFAGRVHLVRALEGGVLRFSTNRREVERSELGRRVGFETHLEVTLPPGTRVAVVNEHGATEVADVAEARVRASFEGVRVERVAGPADIESRHGDVVVADVGGALTLTSKHGAVEVRQVKGRAALRVEHGDVAATNVGGLQLEIRHGGLTTDGVMGDLAVTGEHAGVDASAVTGNVAVETSYQQVSVKRVGGDARLGSRHGEIEAEDVTGGVYAESRYADVTLARIAGPVEVRVTHGGVDARTLAKGAVIRASGDDVIVDGFKGALDIQSDRGGVHLTPSGPVDAAINVRTVHGGIELAVPTGSKFNLDATSAGGEVQASVAGFTTTESGPARVRGTMNGGGSAVVLAADRGNVMLHAVAVVAREGEDAPREPESRDRRNR
jgi:DUF4097 and DUF4098 domain-containing protein YvlB